MVDFVAPSAEDFLDRYPEFANQDENVINLVLNEAISLVTDTWTQYRVAAILALAAHILFTENQTALKSASVATGGAQMTGPVQSQTVGPLSITYKAPATIGSSGRSGGYDSAAALESSPYGIRYLELLGYNQPAAILVV